MSAQAPVERRRRTREATDPAAAIRAEREFVMTDDDFNRVRALARALAGISLSGGKMDMVYNRLSRVLRARKLPAMAGFLDLVEAGDGGAQQQFINALTTNLTKFFREAAHFEVLAGLLRAQGARRPLEIWCAGCSTGEEAYCIAITALETLGAEAQVRVLATDVDTDVLRRAQAAVYPRSAVSEVPLARLKRFFLEGTGANEGKVRPRPEVTRMVRFEHHNLLAPDWSRRGPFLAIFCRNVMIYFDATTQMAVLEKFAPLLLEDGLLFAGHSEYYAHAVRRWTRIAHAVYRRIPGAGDAPSGPRPRPEAA
ncbi:MAG TPA: CheR family methyltransferase [Burkholderiales bacterium]|nr:CheR family methyltransferase [Burkholderiales bacterium]